MQKHWLLRKFSIRERYASSLFDTNCCGSCTAICGDTGHNAFSWHPKQKLRTSLTEQILIEHPGFWAGSFVAVLKRGESFDPLLLSLKRWLGESVKGETTGTVMWLQYSTLCHWLYPSTYSHFVISTHFMNSFLFRSQPQAPVEQIKSYPSSSH